MLILVLLLGISSPINSVPPAAEAAEDTNLFLPLIFEEYPLPFEMVITLWQNGQYPGNYSHLYGYVFDLNADPLYSVILEVDLVDIVCFEPPCDDNSWTVQFSPALPALLPGQVNPFAFSAPCEAKFCDHIVAVRAVSASRTEPNGYVYYPLTVAGWEHIDDTLLGTIRNDSTHSLQNLRLVAQELTKCTWREAEIAASELDPGKETTFTIDFPEYCLGDNLVIVGQGAAQP